MDELAAADDISDGDLGLGEGLKPGGIPLVPETNFNSTEIGQGATDLLFKSLCSSKNTVSMQSSNSGYSTPEDSDDEYEFSLTPIQNIQDLKSQYAYLNVKKTSSRCTETFPVKILQDEENFYDDRYFKSDQCEETNGDCTCSQNSSTGIKDRNKDSEQEFPSYANVPYGTSIRQQKELFKHNIDALRKKMSNTSSTESCAVSKEQLQSECRGDHHKTSSKKRTSEEVAMKLASAMQEVEDLKSELETCESRLDSKYKAIDILKKQADDAHSLRQKTDKVTKDTTMKLAQVQIGDNRVTSLVLGEDQDLGDSSLHLVGGRRENVRERRAERKPGPQQDRSKLVPIEKYKRICEDNRNLTVALEAKTEELRKLTANKMATERENDELLALLDIQERAKYEKSRSVSSEENYCTFTSTELAVLGACRCRVSDPAPCGCAHAAANLKREIIRMKDELLQYKSRRDEAFHTVDAYRTAFEEQLQRNKAMSQQLVKISTMSNTKASRGKSALRWLIGNLNDDDLPEENDTMTTGRAMSDQDLIQYLSDMLLEKKEVLSHQKLASQILADKLRTLEMKLAQYEKEDHEVFS